MTKPSRKRLLSRLFGKGERAPKEAQVPPPDTGKAPVIPAVKDDDTRRATRATVKNAPAADVQRDYGHLLDELPDPKDLDGLNKRVSAIAQASATQRKAGDALVADRTATGETAAGAAAKWKLALVLNSKAIDVVHRYASYDLMFDESGYPLPQAAKSNYPLEGGEQELARVFCDLVGREGGLLRRLDRGEEALKAYSVGAEIEKAGHNFGVVNSYCTMNVIAMQIELGRRRASGSPEPPPDLSIHIAAARRMIEAQFDQGRDRDMWAKADLGMAYVLSGDTLENRNKARDLYYDYAVGAFPQDYDTTLRILRRIERQLRAMRDPVADMVAWATEYLQEERARKIQELRGS